MGYQVLLVDDIATNRKLMRAVLKGNPEIAFLEATDGFQAVQLMAEHDVDLVVLDLMMPGKDGFEVLQEMKVDPRLKDVPVIVNSTMDGLHSIEKALELGANEYFTKPLTPAQMKVILPLKVENALKSYEQHKRLCRLNEQMANELRLAKLFQQTLIVKNQEFPVAKVTGRYIPCLQIGGDFYDCVQRGPDFWFIIADVMGHGIAAAMVSAMIKVLFLNALADAASPCQVLSLMNQDFCNLSDGGYTFSAFIGQISGQQLTYANAGHPYPLLLRADAGEVVKLAQNGFLVGMLAEAEYTSGQTRVLPGDTLLLYTDGIFEPDGQGLSRSAEDLQAMASAQRVKLQQTPEAWLDRLVRPFAEYQGIVDDVALVVINIR